jgi:hypothetical protein
MKRTEKKRLAASPTVYLEDYLKIYTGMIWKTWSLYYCKLMSSAIVCRKNKNDLRPTMIIYLSRTSVWECKQQTNVANSFMIYHPERDEIMFSCEREDQMKVWMNSISQIKNKLSTLDDSDVEAYTSSDEEQNRPVGLFAGCCFSLGKILKVNKHRYHHIVENADFLQNDPIEKEEQKQRVTEGIIQDRDDVIQVSFSISLDQREKLEQITKSLHDSLGINFTSQTKNPKDPVEKHQL